MIPDLVEVNGMVRIMYQEGRCQVCEMRLAGDGIGPGGDPRMSLVFTCHFRGYLGIARGIGFTCAV